MAQLESPKSTSIDILFAITKAQRARKVLKVGTRNELTFGMITHILLFFIAALLSAQAAASRPNCGQLLANSPVIHQLTDSTQDRYSEQEVEAVDAYRSWSSVNSMLRSPEAYTSPENIEYRNSVVPHLDSAFRSTPVALTVFRGLSFWNESDLLRFDITETDSGYLSTTADKAIAQKYSGLRSPDVFRSLILEIRLPAGFPIIDFREEVFNNAYIQTMGKNADQEILLPRGLRLKLSLPITWEGNVGHAVLVPE